MTDEKLATLIRQYQSKSYNAYDTPGHLPRVIIMTDEERAMTLQWISVELLKRGGKFVHDRQQYTVRDGRLVAGMVT